MAYKGKITTSGTSEAIRIEKDLFRQHPEFKRHASVEAHVIGPGQLLISVENPEIESQSDPVMNAFLSFLEGDLARNPQAVSPLDAATMKRARDAHR